MVNPEFSFPADWKIKTLYELSNGGFQNGLFYEVNRKNKGIPIINVGNLYGNIPISNSSLALFDANIEEIESFGAKSGDIFFTRSSIVPSGIAMCNVFLSAEDKPVVFDSHVIKYTTDKTQVNPVFLALQCRMPFAKNHLIGHAKTATMTTIDQDGIGSCSICMPDVLEQDAIVDTLTTFDIYISNLSQLIEKKKAIRDGALEDLVSGRTRLTGFSEKWRKTSIGDCADILQGGTPSTTNNLYWGGSIIWVTPGEITKLPTMYIDDSERKITEAGLQNSSATLLPAGTILLCTRATIGALAIARKPMTTNQGFKNLVCKQGISNVFLAYLLQTLKDTMLSRAIGTTFLEISKKNLGSIEIEIPSFEEQCAIADILTAMDDEIKALEDERDKMIRIREGAMDDLLTGRVRLSI